MGHKYYDLLGIQRGADQEEIKRAYKKMAVKHHPDKGGDVETFKEISLAYETLSNNEKKNIYDQVGDEGYQAAQQGGGMPQHHHFNPHDIFQQMFGGGGGFGGMGGFNFDINLNGGGPGQGHARRRDTMHQIEISLDEAYFGTTKNIKINLKKVCFSCQSTCSQCQGKGHIINMQMMGPFRQIIQQQCDKCNGSGQVFTKNPRCGTCSGKGKYNEDIMKEIIIQRGITSGFKINLTGFGEQTKMQDETPGDLIIEIIIQNHPHFTRSYNDLIFKTDITFIESVLGKNITIPHFTGNFTININKYGIIEPNKQYILKDKGMPINNSDKNFGNLILIFNVSYPQKILTDENIQLLKNSFNSIGL